MNIGKKKMKPNVSMNIPVTINYWNLVKDLSGKSVERIGRSPISGRSLKHIYCYAKNLDFNTSDYKNIILHVPRKLYKKYRKSSQTIFKDIVKARPSEMPIGWKKRNQRKIHDE